jgi:serine/threonine-protein kinase
VYATGIILYELLTGHVPFEGPTPLTVLTAHLTAAPRPPRERAPDRGLSPALEAVVLNAIAKDPAGRYATAGALATAIRSALASPDDVEAVRPAARVNVKVDTTDAHSATLPAPVPGSQRPSVPAPRTPRPSSVRPNSLPPPRSSRAWIVVCVLAGIAGIAIGAWLSMQAR